jgi:hypothetical protein
MNLVELIGVSSEWGPSQSPFENEKEKSLDFGQ